MEDRLHAAALAVSSAEGEQVYEDLVGALARILEVEFATIAVYEQPERSRLRTLARVAGGRILGNVSYPIAGTPCERAIGRAFGYFPSNVRAQFAEDAPLQELGIEGYAAATLNDAAGAPIGLLSVMSRGPLAQRAADRGDAQDLRRAHRLRDRAPARRGGAARERIAVPRHVRRRSRCPGAARCRLPRRRRQSGVPQSDGHAARAGARHEPADRDSAGGARAAVRVARARDRRRARSSSSRRPSAPTAGPPTSRCAACR